MKATSTHSNYLLISAESSFDGDPCHFAIFKFSLKSIDFLEKALTRVSLFQDVENFDCHSYYYHIEGFYRTGIGCTEEELNNILIDGNSFAFIDIEQSELDNLEIPESALDEYKMEITPQGFIRFTAIGEGTETYFKTTYVPLVDVLLKLAKLKIDYLISKSNTENTDKVTYQK